MPEQTTIRARYDDFEAFKSALHTLQESGRRQYEAFGPVNLKEIQELMPDKGSAVRPWATGWAIFGLISFWFMCVASSLLYSLITGGKPPVSNVPFVIPSYEGTILLGSIAAFIAVLVLAKLGIRKPPSDYDPRFSGSEFGIIVHCPPNQRQSVVNLLEQSGAAEVNELS